MRFKGKHHVTKQDLKEDGFQEFTEKALAAYYRDRRKFWIGGAAILVVIVAVILLAQNRGPKVNPQAEIAFTQAVGMYSSNSPEQAEPAFKDVAARFGRDFVGAKAHFYLANIYFNANKITEARQEFATFLGRVKNDPLLSPAARFGIANCDEQSGNNMAAAQGYEAVYRKWPKSPLAYEAVMAAGRSYRNAAAYDKAEAVYNDLMKTKPAGDKAEQVKLELARVEALRGKSK
jgi:TolA-binding protein